LSTWIRDYVYIPLGGSRHGVARRVFNGMVAFGLCGLWHGAAWNFLVWGLWHGAGLAIQGSYPKLLGPFGRVLSAFMARFPVIPWALTLTFVYVGWLWFFYPLPEAVRILRLLFAFSKS